MKAIVKFKKYLTIILLMSCLFFMPLLPCSAQDQYLDISYHQLTTDFFGEGNHEFKPSGSGIGYGIDFTDDWSMGFTYQRSKGDGRWFSHRVVVREFYETGESESTATGLSLSWLANDHGFAFSYNQVDNTESSITYLPFLVESVAVADQVLSLGYIGQWVDSEKTLEDLFSENQNYWAVSWGIGLQNIDSDVDIVENLNTDQSIQLNINLERQSLSLFAEAGISYIFVKETLSWSPYLNLGWNWELDVSGEEYILLSRGDRSITFEQSGARFNNQIRTPDAGTMEFGVSLFWETGSDKNRQTPFDWSLDLGYSKALDTEVDYSGIQMSIRVDF